MTEPVQWCSLFCAGSEAVGELTVPLNDEEVCFVPVCPDCLREVQEDPQGALAVIAGI